jgi:hypothetical protein
MSCNNNDNGDCGGCTQDITNSSCRAFCIPKKIYFNQSLSNELSLMNQEINYTKFIKFNKYQCRRNANNSIIPGICDQHAKYLNLNYYWNAIGTTDMNTIFGISPELNGINLGNNIKLIFAFFVKLSLCKIPTILSLMENLNIPFREFIKIVFSPLGFHIFDHELMLVFMTLALERKIQVSLNDNKHIPKTLNYTMFANLILRWIPWLEDGKENYPNLKVSKDDLEMIKWNKLSKLLVGAFVSSSSDTFVNIFPKFRKDWQSIWTNKFNSLYSIDSKSKIYWMNLIQQLEYANKTIELREKMIYESRIISIGSNPEMPFCSK